MKNKLRLALLVSGILNIVMGFVEIIASLFAGSTALFIDSLDFFVDGVNYFSSIYLLRKSKQLQEKIGKIKGYCMIGAGTLVFVWIFYKLFYGWIPRGGVMSVIGTLALAVNILSTWLLQKFQNNSLDLRAVWLCTRNDAIGNILIIIAGYLTLLSHSIYPDIIISIFIGYLALQSGISIIRFGHDDCHNHCHTDVSTDS